MKAFIYIYKNKRYFCGYGMSLIEVVVSMWIFGIAVMSIISLLFSHAPRNNQSKIQAISIARSEFERLRLAGELNNTVPTSYIAVILHQESVKKNFGYEDKSKESEKASRFFQTRKVFSSEKYGQEGIYESFEKSDGPNLDFSDLENPENSVNPKVKSQDLASSLRDFLFINADYPNKKEQDKENNTVSYDREKTKGLKPFLVCVSVESGANDEFQNKKDLNENEFLVKKYIRNVYVLVCWTEKDESNNTIKPRRLRFQGQIYTSGVDVPKI